MKRYGKVILSVVAVMVMAAAAVNWLVPSGDEKVEKTRGELRAAGFKVDLKEFDFSTPVEVQTRVRALTNATRRAVEAPWEIEEAAKAAISGPIRFHLDASKGMGMLLPHLVSLKSYQNQFARGVVLKLREGNKEGGWTNLLAASRLVTAWEPESVEVSHLVRFACTKFAFEALSQGLQAGWNEEQLASLQRDWEEADFFRGLPATVAFTRASGANMLESERKEPVELGMKFRQMITAPRAAMDNLSYYFQRLRYRRSGSYDVEREALLHFRARELEIRNAVKAGSWEEMKKIPGVTNFVPFQSPYPSALMSVLNNRQVMMASMMYRTPGGGSTLLGRASEAEAQRRIIVAAIALERYRSRQGRYPDELRKLVPEFLKEEPVDFMDGEALRYRLGEDGRFVLYSVGLDGVDDGGSAGEEARPADYRGMFPDVSVRSNRDIVWPYRAR